jgi:cell division protein FtsB
VIIDFRYHIASLVAVFLALGLGILVGGIMLKSDVLVDRQKQMTDKLEIQLEQLRQKNEAVEAQVSSLQVNYKAQEEFEKQILPLLVKGRLEGYQIALVETNSYSFSDDLIAVLQMAGVKVLSVTTIMGSFDQSVNMEALKARLSWKDVGDGQLATRLASEVARGILVNDNRPVLDSLVEAGVVKISGEYGKPLSGVVIIGGSQEREMIKTGAVDLPVIDYFLAGKIPVYGVEEMDIPYSYMKEYQKRRISTVDNIDSVPGQVALVLAMAGKSGHYGIKPTAQKLLPALDDAKEVKNVLR